MRASGLLDVEGLTVAFNTAAGPACVVADVSFSIARGETLALVGESGSGKSMTALSILNLVPFPGRVATGRITFEGRDLLGLAERDIRGVRGGGIGMVFQEPTAALNPVLTIGRQIEETLAVHGIARGREARHRAIELLASVSIPDPERRLDAYVHELSGGLRQRAMIAIALACRPPLLIADEPTTALDVTIQAQILDLLRELRDRDGLAVLLVTHDLGVVAEMADRVAVMYAGRIVEQAAVRDLFATPRHPYTRGLLASIPAAQPRGGPLPSIPGSVPAPGHLPPGCAFAPRCPDRFEACDSAVPGWTSTSTGDPANLTGRYESGVRCFLYSEAVESGPASRDAC